MDYYKSIKKSKLDILKESYDTMNTESKIGELQAFQIYDELQKLPNEKAKLDFLTGIAAKANIPLAALTSQVGELTRSRAKAAKGSGSGSTTTDSISITDIPFDFPDSVHTKDSNGVDIVVSSPTLDNINTALAAGHTIEEIGKYLELSDDMISQLKKAIKTSAPTKSTKKKTTTPTTTPAFVS